MTCSTGHVRNKVWQKGQETLPVTSFSIFIFSRVYCFDLIYCKFVGFSEFFFLGGGGGGLCSFKHIFTQRSKFCGKKKELKFYSGFHNRKAGTGFHCNLSLSVHVGCFPT